MRRTSKLPWRPRSSQHGITVCHNFVPTSLYYSTSDVVLFVWTSLTVPLALFFQSAGVRCAHHRSHTLSITSRYGIQVWLCSCLVRFSYRWTLKSLMLPSTRSFACLVSSWLVYCLLTETRYSQIRYQHRKRFRVAWLLLNAWLVTNGLPVWQHILSPRCSKKVYFAEKALGPGGKGVAQKTWLHLSVFLLTDGKCVDWHKMCLNCKSCGKLVDSTTLADKDGEVRRRHCTVVPSCQRVSYFCCNY
jgi:hypothetical protein